MPHPLASETYAALVRNSDVGMFLYDSRRYVARCSGILVEMLSSGVPVIVPAGCWLSAQINAPNQAWLAQVAGRHAEAETVYVPRPRDAIEIDLPLGVGQVLVELDLATDDPLAKSPSASLEVRVVQSGSRMTASNTFVVDDGGSPASERLVRVMVDRAAGADRIRWSFASPFGGSVPQLASVSLRLISERTGDEPHGALGVTVASIDEAPAALDQILRHHDHYRRQAAAFSEQWRREHSPETVVERLTAHVPDGQRSTRAA